jgi:hypothetical protein
MDGAYDEIVLDLARPGRLTESRWLRFTPDTERRADEIEMFEGHSSAH